MFTVTRVDITAEIRCKNSAGLVERIIDLDLEGPDEEHPAGYCWRDHVQAELGQYPKLETVLEHNPKDVEIMVATKLHHKRRFKPFKRLKQAWRNFRCKGYCEWRDGCTCYEPSVEQQYGLEKRYRDGVLMSCSSAPVTKVEGIETTVGSAVSMVQSAKRILTAEIGKMAATNEFTNDLASVPTVQFRLTPAEQMVAERELGYGIRSMQKHVNNIGHKTLQIERIMARQALDNLYPHNTDRTSALHVGATLSEVSRWYSHAGHDFYFHLKEDKDVLRVCLMLINMLGKKIGNMALPALTSIKGNTTRLQNLSLTECMDLLAERGRQRFFFDIHFERRYDVLFFEDCMYDMTKDDWLFWWKKTGAKIGHGIIFAPDPLVTTQAPKSSFYEYDEVLPYQEDIEALIDNIWPECTLVTAFLPLHELREAFLSILRKLLAKGADVLKRVLLAASNSGDLMFSILGPIFEVLKLQSILNKLMHKIGKQIWDLMAYSRVVWSSGSGNGYYHKRSTWVSWLHNRRWKTEDVCVDGELNEVHGEMWLMSYHRSTGTSRITYSIALPPHKRVIMVMDPFASYEKGVGFGKIKRIPVYAEDWLKLINWGLAEPVESLDFPVLMTTLNRIRGGLSLGENVMVAPMHMFSEDVRKIALAAVMYLFQLNGLSSEIENDPEVKNAYRKNIATLAENCLKYGLVVLTGGLAVPIIFAVKWLLSESPNLEIVENAEQIKVITVQGKKSRDDPFHLTQDFNLVLPHKAPEKRNACFICDLQERGCFSKTGVPNEGQEFLCERPGESGEMEIVFDPGEMVTVTGRIRTAKEEHRALNAMKLVEIIGKMQDWFEANIGTTQHTKLNVSLLRGGPGTGKSTVIRVIAKKFEETGLSVVIGSPFSKLLDDYSQADVVGYKGLHDFEAETFWYIAKHANIDVLIVDEVTNIDWELLKAMSLYCGVKKLIIVGDEGQTHLNYPAGEGLDPLNDEVAPVPLDLSKIPTHTLVWNFRNPPFIVKWLNFRYGYKMRSRRSDWDKIPIFITKQEYNRLPPEEKADRELVFAHVAANETFGKESIRDSKDQNMSVRSAQGMTYGNTAISWTQLDLPVADVRGMQVVAFSRHKRTMYIVITTTMDDQHIQELRDHLCLTDDLSVEMLKRLPWPDIPNPKIDRNLTPEEERVDSLIRKLNHKNKVAIERDFYGSEDGTDVDQMESMEIKQIEVKVPELLVNPLVQVIEERPLEDFFKTVFAQCVGDCLITKFANANEMHELYWKWYNDDKLMGRERPVYKSIWSTNFSSHPPLTKDKDGLYLPTLKLWSDFFEEKDYRVSFWKAGKLYWASSKWHSADANGPECNMVLENSHATLKEVVYEAVTSIHLPQDLMVDALAFHNGKRFFQYPCNNRGRRILKDAPTETVTTGFEMATAIGYGIRKPSGLTREAEELATRHAPIIGSRVLHMERPWSYEKQPIKKTKLRAGKDAFRMKNLFDPSGAETRYPIVNWPYGVMGNVETKYCDVKPEGFIFARTKAGRLKQIPKKKVHSFTPGMVHHFSDSSEETLIALERIGKTDIKPRLTHEAKLWAEKAARKYFEENFNDIDMDYVQKNAIVESALDAVRQRNYDGRRLSDKKKDPMEKLRILVSNKSLAKFKWPFKVTKYGQALSMAPPRINQEFVAFWRILNNKMKFQAKPEMFFDSYEHQEDFVMRISKAIKELPEAVSFAIIDADNFDSQQNEVTLYAEKCFFELLGADPRSLEEYYKIRQVGIPWSLIGRAYGTMNGEKGSGYPDTLPGNTTCEGIAAEMQFVGLGPKVRAGKGDDQLLVQAALREDTKGAAEVKAYMGLKLHAKIGESGSFIGYSVFKEGFVPDVVKSTYKALAAPARDYKHFCEQQKAYRDKIDQVNKMGGMAAAQRGAIASGYSENLGAAAFEILNSLGHLSKKDWERNTKTWVRPRFFLRNHLGPNLI